MVWFALHWAKQEIELFPPFPVCFLDTLTRIVSYLIGVTVIASNQKLEINVKLFKSISYLKIWI